MNFCVGLFFFFLSDAVADTSPEGSSVSVCEFYSAPPISSSSFTTACCQMSMNGVQQDFLINSLRIPTETDAAYLLFNKLAQINVFCQDGVSVHTTGLLTASYSSLMWHSLQNWLYSIQTDASDKHKDVHKQPPTIFLVALSFQLFLFVPQSTSVIFCLMKSFYNFLCTMYF